MHRPGCKSVIGSATVGLTTSMAIRLFLRSVFEHGGIPIEVAIPNAKTIAAIKAAKAWKTTDIAFEDF